MMSNVIRFLIAFLPPFYSYFRVNITGRCTDPRRSSCRTKEGHGGMIWENKP